MIRERDRTLDPNMQHVFMLWWMIPVSLIPEQEAACSPAQTVQHTGDGKLPAAEGNEYKRAKLH